MKKLLLFFILIIFFESSINAQEHIVQDLKIQGNKRLKTSFVKNISIIKVGCVLDSTIIEQDILRLKRLPSVSHVYYEVFHSEKKSI